jgi:RHS repeat-associated protein
MYSVRAVASSAGYVRERIDYTPYGKAMHRYAGDYNGDGQIDLSDITILNAQGSKVPGDSGYNPHVDLNGNGSVDSGDTAVFSADFSFVSTNANGVPPEGWLSDHVRTSVDGTDNQFGFDGYWFDAAGATDGGSTGLYCVRNRVYDSGMGRWLTRDPAEYADGMGQYTGMRSNPIALKDPSGLTPKLWTGSGINNWTGTAFNDYVAGMMNLASDKSFTSKLGTNPPYLAGNAAHAAGGRYIKGLDSEGALDFEAESYALTRRAGEFASADCKPTKVTVFLIAPKTTTKPSVDSKICDVTVNVYFSPWDRVPNQAGLFGPGDSANTSYWEQFALNGFVAAVNTNFTPGYVPVGRYPNHNLGAFISSTGKLRHENWSWIPDAPAQIRSFMRTDSEYVFVGHSQGTNIMMHILNHVCNKGGIKASNDGQP